MFPANLRQERDMRRSPLPSERRQAGFPRSGAGTERLQVLPESPIIHYFSAGFKRPFDVFRMAGQDN